MQKQGRFVLVSFAIRPYERFISRPRFVLALFHKGTNWMTCDHNFPYQLMSADVFSAFQELEVELENRREHCSPCWTNQGSGRTREREKNGPNPTLA